MPDYAGKLEGMERAEAGASPEWKHYATLVITALAREVKEFTSDEVWEGLKLCGIQAPEEPRAMGPMMRNAAKAGLITKTGYSRVSNQENNHARPVAVWRSLNYAIDGEVLPPRQRKGLFPSIWNAIKVSYLWLKVIVVGY